MTGELEKVAFVNHKYPIYQIYYYFHKMRTAPWKQNRTGKQRGKEQKKTSWRQMAMFTFSWIKDFFLLYYKCIHVYLSRISKLIMHVHLIHVIWSLGYNNRTKVSVILFPVIGIGNESKAIQLYFTVLYWLRIGLPQGTPEGIEKIILSSSR